MSTHSRKVGTNMQQRIFLSITAGPTPRDVEPVVCTEDRSVIEAALAAIERRLGCGKPEEEGDRDAKRGEGRR
jgi:hypothetical protein